MHLKRSEMPPYWGLGVKERTFAVSPRGPHTKSRSIPLRVVIRDLLKAAGTGREAKQALAQGKVLVDKKVRKDHAFGVGLMDLVEIPDLKACYRVDVAPAGLLLKEVPQEGNKVCKVIGKTVVRGGKEQLHLHDGRNLLGGKGVAPGDSLLISLPDQKVLAHYPFRSGAEALIVGGKNRGARGTILSVAGRRYMNEQATATLRVEGREVQTLRGYIFVVGEGGKASPAVKDAEAPRRAPRRPRARKEA